MGEFGKFIRRGNVLDLAVGVIIGAAFGKIVTSLVNDVLMPPMGLLLGKVDFSNLYFNLSNTPADSLAAAKAAGLPTINYGQFINTVIEFAIVAWVIFLVVRTVNRVLESPPPPPATPTTRECPQCLSAIPIKAHRCAHCTSTVVPEAPGTAG